MANVIIIAPLNAIGGINSWSRNMRANFPKHLHKIFYIDNLAKTYQVTETNPLKKKWNLVSHKVFDLFRILKVVKSTIIKQNIQVLHTTTSGSAGTYRDYFVAKICKKRGVKCIMQCRYGKIPNILEKKSIYSKFLIKVMSMYDRIWVLDNKSYKVLQDFSELNGKVEVIPNTIDCPDNCDTFPSSFKKVVFVASVVPTKGILELVKAISNSECDFSLKVAGNASELMKNRIKEIASKKYGGKWLEILGPLENSKAKELIKKSDILALPTYYQGEAFPISILEAMSFGKMVVSTNRAAIPDMLKINNDKFCGVIVKEKDEISLQNGLEFCYNNPEQANLMCRKAYEKVKNNYTNKVVFNLYSEKYNDILKN